MRRLTGLRALKRTPKRSVVTVVVFDGVHLAHQQIIRRTVWLAKRLRATSVVITFDPDPEVVMRPTATCSSLMPLQIRLNHMEKLGVDCALTIPFTKRFSRITAEEFATRILLKRLRTVALLVGETFVFGRNKRGDVDLLKTLGRRHAIRIIPIRPINRGGSAISSSRIRRLIRVRRLKEARQLLGRHPALYGTVVRGAGRGYQLGFPTANVKLTRQVLPPQGIYAVNVTVGRREGLGVMNLGNRPTFGRGPLTCEVHMLGSCRNLLGRYLSIALLARLRAERHFSTPAALSRQIARDITRTRRLFAKRAITSSV